MGDKCLALSARVRAAGSLEVLIYDEVGDGFFGPGVTAKSVREQLDRAGMVSNIDVRINSLGGDTAQGFAIYNALREHPATVTVHIDGDAMSIASIIAQAGDHRVIAPNARVMIHEAKLFPGRPMGERELRSALQNVGQVNQSLVDTYVKHTGQDAEQIRQWMAAETFMSATDAKARGFVDEISGESESVRIAAWETVRLVGPEGAERGHAMAFLKTVALAIGLSETADEGAIAARAGELRAQAEAGKTATKERDDLVLALGCDNFEAARGAAAAGRAAIERAETVARELDELTAKATREREQREREEVLASIRAAGQATPAQERDLLPTLTTEALRAFAKCAPKVVGRTGHEEPTGSSLSAEAFAELKPAARAELRNTNRALYDALHTEAKAKGLL